jgi:hypothetical protein
VESLNQKVSAISADLYKQAAGAPGTVDPPPDATPGSEAAQAAPGKDDVVDADFEMVDKDEKGQK